MNDDDYIFEKDVKWVWFDDRAAGIETDTPVFFREDKATIRDDDKRLSELYNVDDESELFADPSEQMTVDGVDYYITAFVIPYIFLDSKGEEFEEPFLVGGAWTEDTGNEDILAPNYFDFIFVIPTREKTNFDDGSILLVIDDWDRELIDGLPWEGKGGVFCFESKTLIQTSQGMKEINKIEQGDEVFTQSGLRTVSWIGGRTVSSSDMASNPKLKPVRITSGALGDGLPLRDLIVSRQHRVLINSIISERMFGKRDVLIPAIKLTELPGIYVDDDFDGVEYFHLLFDKHEIVYSEGLATESLFTGPEALKTLGPEACEEIFTLFPELKDRDYSPEPAHYIPENKRQKKLIARHIKNKRPVYGAGA